jgi:murein DD-endopeptidase MepM/ murein hydrolase activator NlpD
MVASDGGRVTWAGWGAYGIYVQIDHGNGFSTLYGHMARTYVSVGQYVDRGQSIGLMGSTGRSSGPHVHFELHYQGVPQDPLRYLP